MYIRFVELPQPTKRLLMQMILYWNQSCEVSDKILNFNTILGCRTQRRIFTCCLINYFGILLFRTIGSIIQVRRQRDDII